MFDHLTRDDLVETLSRVEPVDLLGLELLLQFRPQSPGWFPDAVDTGELVAATTQLIDYTATCRAALRRLQQLPPVPLTDLAVEEFSL